MVYKQIHGEEAVKFAKTNPLHPAVSQDLGMDLEPHGESLLTLAPAGAVTSAQVQATLDRSGFELTRRRRRPRPSRLRHALTTAPVDDGREILTEA